MAASSSIGSDVFFGLSFAVICILVLLLIRYYLPLRSTPAYLVLPVFLALALPSSIILLVPIDLASSTGTDSHNRRGVWLPKSLLLVCWRISYWLTFCLTWFILPLLGEYADSGARSPKSRFIYSLRSNARYQLIYLACAVVGAVYFFMQSGVNFISLRALVMALAYAWGLILALYLMGNGLVAMPKRLFKDASVSGRLRRLQQRAPRLHERMTDAMDAMVDLEEQVMLLRQKKTGSAREFQDWIEDLADSLRLPDDVVPSTGTGPRTSAAPKMPNVITERYLANFTRKLKRARHKRTRFIAEWQRLVREAARTQKILDSKATKSLKFDEAQDTGIKALLSGPLTPRTRYYLHTQILPAMRIVLGGILCVASACIVWSEIVKHTFRKASIIDLTVVNHPSNGEGRGELRFRNQIVAAAWLCYMCAAALYSITEVKVWGNRALVKRQTYPESACWYAGQVAKLTVPLAYNFAEMVEPNIFKGTVFYEFLGKLVDLTPLGAGFSAWFPMFVVIPVLASLFGLYAKVKRWTGFGDWVLADDEEDEQNRGEALLGSGSWREGQALIERELNGPASASAGSGAVGLFSRDATTRPSVDGNGGRGSFDHRRAAAASRTEPSLSSFSSSRTPAARHDRAADPGRRAAAQRAEEDEEEEENFFQGFTRRVKNTFDTTDRPAWLDNLRPKWLDNDSKNKAGSGDGGGPDNNGDASSSREGSGPNLGKWFGGRAREGLVRL